VAKLHPAPGAALRGQLGGDPNGFLPHAQGACCGFDRCLTFPAGGKLSLYGRAPIASDDSWRRFTSQVGDPPHHGSAPRTRPGPGLGRGFQLLTRPTGFC